MIISIMLLIKSLIKLIGNINKDEISLKPSLDFYNIQIAKLKMKTKK